MSTCGYDDYPVLKKNFFGAVKLIKNADIDNYKYSGYRNGFDRRGIFSFPTGKFGYNLIFGLEMSSSIHVDNKKKDISILGEVPTQGLDDVTLTAKKSYSINFTETENKFCLSLHYNGANSLLVSGTEIIKFKEKGSEINSILICLGNISKDFSADNMKKTGFYY